MKLDYQEIMTNEKRECSNEEAIQAKLSDIRIEILVWAVGLFFSVFVSIVVIWKNVGNPTAAFGEIGFLLLCVTIVLTPSCRAILSIKNSKEIVWLLMVSTVISALCLLAYILLYDLAPSILSAVIGWIGIAATISISSVMFVRSKKYISKNKRR